MTSKLEIPRVVVSANTRLTKQDRCFGWVSRSLRRVFFHSSLLDVGKLKV